MPLSRKRMHSVAAPAKLRGHHQRSQDRERDDFALEDFTAMYVDDQGKSVDMTTLDKKRWRGKWIIGMVLLLILIVAAVAGGYWVFRRDFREPGSVQLTMRIDDRIASGDVVEIELTYENKKNVALTQGDIEFFYPEGFYLQSSSPEPVDANRRIWDTGQIAAGAGGKIRLIGQLVGAKDAVKEFSALWTYQSQNFSEDFQERVQATTIITSSLAELSLDVPKQIQAGQELTVTVQYKNTSPAPLQNVKIFLTAPEGWKQTSADPKSSRNDNDWRFTTLAPGEKGTIEVKGSVSGSSGATKEFHVQMGLLEIDNSFNVQVEQRSLVVIVNPEVQLSVTMAALTKPGTEFPITVTVQNTSEAVLTNIQLVASMEGTLFQENEKQLEDIKKLQPQETVERAFKTVLRNDTTLADQELHVTVRVPSASVGGNTIAFPNVASARTKVEGDLSVVAEARYFNDDLVKIGNGPLPPVVNHTTTYSIVWSITNGGNTADDVSITTTLPNAVIWSDTASEGVVYDSTMRKISYSIKKLPAFTKSVVSFSVSISPTNEDLNSLMVLTGDTVVSGHNTFTNQDIAIQQKRLTTELATDEGASGKGVVIGDSEEPAP